MDEAERGRVATDSPALVENPLHLLAKLLRRGIREDAVGETAGPTDRRLRATADQDRDPGRRRRSHPERREVVDRPVVGERRTAPGLWQDLEDLLHRRPASAHLGPESPEFNVRPAEPQTQ